MRNRYTNTFSDFSYEYTVYGSTFHTLKYNKFTIILNQIVRIILNVKYINGKNCLLDMWNILKLK